MTGLVKKSIGLLGFKPVQRQVVLSICSLSRNRNIAYTLSESDSLDDVDLLLVDTENPGFAENHNASASERDNLRTLYIGAHPVADAAHQIRRSELAGQLLNVLDTMSQQVDAAQAINVAGSIGKPRILIIDDSLSVRTQMSIFLQKMHVDVDSVDSAEKGVQVVAKAKIDLVFLDIMLPGIDGYEACGKLKRASSTALPVVLLTSKSSPFNKVRGVMAGCDRYLTKPADGEEIAGVVTHFLGAAFAGDRADSNSTAVAQGAR